MACSLPVGATFAAMRLGGARSFRAPMARELLSLCVAKEKVTQEKGHPAWRFSPIHGRKVREPGAGFSTARPCAGEKASTSCRCPLCGLSPPSHRRTGAPGRAARSCAHSSRSHIRNALLSCALLSQPLRGCAPSASRDGSLLCRDPCAAVRHGRPARRGIGTMPIPFRRHTDVPSKSQAIPHALSGRDARKAPSGVASLWVTFLWPSREK